MPDDMDRVQERVALHLERAIEAHRQGYIGNPEFVAGLAIGMAISSIGRWVARKAGRHA